MATQAAHRNVEIDSRHIDFSNLCGGNDFAALTNNYERGKINELIWSVKSNSDRVFVVKAVGLEQQIKNCPQENNQLYFELLEKQVKLQEDFENKRSITVPPPQVGTRGGYNTTESAVLMYFLMDGAVNTTNAGGKNCLQKNAQQAYSKTFGWQPKSYEGKINLDFTDPAVRTAMEKVANDYKDVYPDMVKEIWHQYNEYEEDFYEKHPEKIKK